MKNKNLKILKNVFINSGENRLKLVDLIFDEQIEKIVSWLEAWPERRRDSTSVTSINRQPKVRRSLLRRPSFSSA